LDPAQKITWIGKTFDLKYGKIENTQKTLLRLLGMGLLSMLLPVNTKKLDTLLGVTNWAFRPLPGYILFTGPWYSWRWSKDRELRSFSPKRLTQLMMDVIILAGQGWRVSSFHPPHFCSPIFCCDAALTDGKYQVGIFGTIIDHRILECPKWVSSQQQAEYVGLVETIKKSQIHLGIHSITLIGDNMATLQSFLGMKPFYHQWDLMKLLRGLFNFMYDKHILIQLWWCPTDLMPADPLSRKMVLTDSDAKQVILDTQTKFKNLLSTLSSLKFIGEVHL